MSGGADDDAPAGMVQASIDLQSEVQKLAMVYSGMLNELHARVKWNAAITMEHLDGLQQLSTAAEARSRKAHVLALELQRHIQDTTAEMSDVSQLQEKTKQVRALVVQLEQKLLTYVASTGGAQ